MLHLQGEGYWNVVSGATANNKADPDWIKKNGASSSHHTIESSTVDNTQSIHNFLFNIEIASEQ